MLKIGIYDPYLFELGGGERYVALIAETLQHQFDVSLISHDKTEISKINQRFGLALENVQKRQLPEKTEKGDKPSCQGWIRNFICDMASSRRTAEFSADYDIFINLSNSVPFQSLAERSILLLQMPYHLLINKIPGIRAQIRKMIGWKLTLEENLKLKSYSKIISNSIFTQKWIKKFWGCDSEVIYTGIDPNIYKVRTKKNIILGVGRFQRNTFCKNQHLLVDVFTSMCHQGLEGWELHLAGGLSDKREDMEYFIMVAEKSKNIPIRLYPNIAMNDLLYLYSESRIFWHATGLENDDSKTPWEMEHFGLTTVEAMASGCVPVVIRKGGQPEIVLNYVNGLLWESIDELRSKTFQLINDKNLEQRLSANAILRSRDFGVDIFRQNTKDLIYSLDTVVVT